MRDIKYKKLLSPLKVGNVVLRNHMFRGASIPHYLQGPEEYPTENTIAHYAASARGGAAVVVCSGATLYPDTGIPAHYINGNLKNVRGQNYFAQMADAVHFGGAKAALNLPTPWQAGYDVSDGIPVRFTVSDEPVSETEVSREITPQLLDDFIDQYLELCHIAKNCGFDMVYIHMAYQYALPARFLSPLLNHRTDEFGGPIENRAKPAIMLLKRIKEELGRDFLIEISISPVEEPGGMTMDETVRFIELVQDYVDFVQPRGESKEASNAVGFKSPQPLRGLSRAFKERVRDLNVLVVTSGGYHDPDVCEDVLASGDADIIDMGRLWISNPDFGTLLYDGKEKDVIPCILCNKCHTSSIKDPYISVCSVNPYLGYDDRRDWMIHAASDKKKVAVVGGGPGGMRAALFCRERGHDVTLYEKDNELGGMLRHTDYVSFKWPLKRYKDWLIRQVRDKGIRIIMGVVATRERLEAENYDDVIVAVGARPIRPRIPGADGKNVLTAAEVFGNEAVVGEKVVVIGGGEIGVECALHLCMQGRTVTVLEMQDTLAPDANPVHYRESLEDAWKAQSSFNAILHARCEEMTEKGVIYASTAGEKKEIKADTIILAMGMRPCQDEAMALFGNRYRTHMIGDCERPGNIQKVNRAALAAASLI